jgi:arylsulfatase A-like enzyme
VARSRSPRRSLLGALALLGAVGCGEQSRDGAASAPAGVPGVVLICIDTLRADSITLAPDAAAGPMPALEAFAREGTAFSDASTTAPWTAPALASVLSGLDVARTGVAGRDSVGLVSPSVHTLAERLAESGWSTAAYTSSGWVCADRGYAQGFQAFHATFDAHGPETCLAEWRRARPEGKPFFLFLHTYAAHEPYGPKVADEMGAPIPIPRSTPELTAVAAEHRRTADATGLMAPASALWFLEHALTDTSSRTAIQLALGGPKTGHPTRTAHPWARVLAAVEGVDPADPVRAAVAGRLRSAYAAGLAETDRVFRRTLAALRAAGVTQETPIVVVGDHGEAFGEHEAFSHGRFLYDEHLRVPLLVRAPGRFPKRVVAGSCGLADVAPTILGLAGVDASDVDGRSLLALARGEEAGHVVLAEETLYPEDNAVAVRRRSVRTDAAKYLLTVDFATRRVVREELFDLRLDPGERAAIALDAVGSFGPEFCRAVARLRESATGVAVLSPCVLAAVR